MGKGRKNSSCLLCHSQERERESEATGIDNLIIPMNHRQKSTQFHLIQDYTTNTAFVFLSPFYLQSLVSLIRNLKTGYFQGFSKFRGKTEL